MSNGNGPMTATITLPTPDGGEQEVEVTFEWYPRERNPFGKEESQYRGENDAWEPKYIQLCN